MNRARLKRRLVKATRYEFRYATYERGGFVNVAMLSSAEALSFRVHGFQFTPRDRIIFRRMRRP